ncbi:hypothetical protein SORBI_3003G142000 [Sorghum bicolor]|uniref:Uncharacterized protein n=1 Tax=Sorghum bicolor TaxID=4558 RepID=A0A1W0VX98_SORBI|nr:hypothetical protein SORBI_3003G142000 [Sorghum bicolor]
MIRVQIYAHSNRLEQVLNFSEQQRIVSASHLLLFDLVQCSDIHIIAPLENLFLFCDRCSNTLFMSDSDLIADMTLKILDLSDRVYWSLVELPCASMSLIDAIFSKTQEACSG